ncbi:DUF3631 domain-containing protein [Streptomyces albidochromogenes]|uniref:DUF3631 domain-containing protein n=1 Tax=Streptomyces albidochromogenes TaxID=329524 RepID=UPI00110F9C84|nr:DUF3631 domain-containing protein [Streptomyces albidochromogenes]
MIREDMTPAEILTELKETMQDYVIFPSEEAAIATTLWAAATYGQQAWQHAPRLVITGPTKRCGKSRLMDVVYEATHRPLITVNSTVAAVFRSIGDDPPTLLVDEADTIFGSQKAAENNEELRGLLNAGHQRNRPTLRVVGVGTEQTVKEFPTFCMAGIAGIGDMPDTIMDRAVIIQMRRRAPHEQVKPFRTRRDAPRLQVLGLQLSTWLRERTDELCEIEPEMPLEDRAADTWEPLIIVADLAGDIWPKLAREAALKLIGERDESDGSGSQESRILTDCRKAFRAAGWPAEMTTEDLLTALNTDREAPWGEYGTNGLTARRLAIMLEKYGVRSGNIRPADGPQKKGFLRIKFDDSWARYCPTEKPEAVPGSDPSQPSQASLPWSARDGSDTWDGSSRPTETTRTSLTSVNDVGTVGTGPDENTIPEAS